VYSDSLLEMYRVVVVEMCDIDVVFQHF